MVDNFIFSINSVLPVFLVMLFGVFLKETKLIDGNGARQMNAILFNFALPIKLCMDVAASDFAELMDIQLIAYSVSTVFIWFLICWGYAHFFVPDRKMKGAFVQGSFRCNYAIIGLPLVNSIMGHGVSKAAVITTFVVPTFNVLSVLILTVYSGEEIDLKSMASSSIKNIVKNPLIIGILIGIILSVSGIRIPIAIDKSLAYISDLSTPLALISIGASMNFRDVKERIRPTLVVSFLKLVAMPLLFLSIAMLIGMPSESLVILFVLYAAPTAVSSYVMAAYMGSDDQLASNIILLTSLLSVFTYTIGVYLFKTLGIV